MRLILASAGIALLASSVSATAADCTKGLLWPYVRHPGDCLTDAEIQAGKTGVYTGPATGQVDVSAIKPPPQLNSASPPLIQCSHSWYWPFGIGDCQPVAAAASASSSAGSGATAGSPAAKDDAPVGKPQASASPAAPPGVEPVQSRPVTKPQVAVATPATIMKIAAASAAECHKGILWPFVRDDGDCPTGAEAGTGKASPVPGASSPAAMPVSAATVPMPAQPNAAVSATTAVACTKGTLWPFIRESGDCLTAAEKSGGKTPAVPADASEPGAMPVSLPAPPPAPSVQPAAVVNPSTPATCARGAFWPFIRESGDCLTAAEKSGGKTPAVPAGASEAVAMPVSLPSPPPAPSVQPAAVVNPSTPATCARGPFWPFIRESGDCATAAEKGSGKTSAVPIDATAPVANPVPLPAVAATPEQAPPVQNNAPPPTGPGACHKGLFWPFVRDAGDCPTDADKGAQRNPS